MIKKLTGRTIGLILAYILNLVLISPLFILIEIFTDYKALIPWMIAGIIMLGINYAKDKEII